MYTRVPKLYRTALEKIFKEYFETNDYKIILVDYKNLFDLEKMSLPLEDWDSIYIKIFIGNDYDKLANFLENSNNDKEFSKKELLNKAKEKLEDATYKYIESVKKF